MMAYTQLTLACFLFLMIGATMAAEYTVGDAAGWTTRVDYSQWASKHKFQKGDTLVFKWQGKGPYRVVAVTKKELDSCKVDNKLVIFPNVSEYKFQILKSGDYFFVNDLPFDACARGMRLQIRAEEAHAAPAKKDSRPLGRSYKDKKDKKKKDKHHRSDAASTATLSLSTTLTITFCLALFLASNFN